MLDGLSLGLRSLDAIADLGSAPDNRIAFSVSYDQFGPNLKQQNAYIFTPPSTITLGIDLAARGLFNLDALDIVPGPLGLTQPIISTGGSQFLLTPSGIVYIDQRSAYQLDLATTPVTVTPVLTGPFVDLDAVALALGIFP